MPLAAFLIARSLRRRRDPCCNHRMSEQYSGSTERREVGNVFDAGVWSVGIHSRIASCAVWSPTQAVLLVNTSWLPPSAKIALCYLRPVLRRRKERMSTDGKSSTSGARAGRYCANPRPDRFTTGTGREPDKHRSAPNFLRDLDGESKFLRLLSYREVIAMYCAREAALRRECELLERHILRRLVDASLDVVFVLEPAVLGGDQAENDDLAPRQETQWPESPLRSSSYSRKYASRFISASNASATGS